MHAAAEKMSHLSVLANDQSSRAYTITLRVARKNSGKENTQKISVLTLFHLPLSPNLISRSGAYVSHHTKPRQSMYEIVRVNIGDQN